MNTFNWCFLCQVNVPNRKLTCVIQTPGRELWRFWKQKLNVHVFTCSIFSQAFDDRTCLMLQVTFSAKELLSLLETLKPAGEAAQVAAPGCREELTLFRDTSSFRLSYLCSNLENSLRRFWYRCLSWSSSVCRDASRWETLPPSTETHTHTHTRTHL